MRERKSIFVYGSRDGRIPALEYDNWLPRSRTVGLPEQVPTGRLQPTQYESPQAGPRCPRLKARTNVNGPAYTSRTRQPVVIFEPAYSAVTKTATDTNQIHSRTKSKTMPPSACLPTRPSQDQTVRMDPFPLVLVFLQMIAILAASAASDIHLRLGSP